MNTPGLEPYPEIRTLLHRLWGEIQHILGERALALYVHGSLAMGDFAPERSDIDFLVVTASPLSSTSTHQLAAMHAQLRAQEPPWALRLEGSYIPRMALWRYDPARTEHPALQVNGTFGVEHHGSDWIIQRYILRRYGIVIAGPPPNAFIAPVSQNELKRATENTLREWWAPMLTNPARLRDREYQAYAVLTMCRALYTLTYGDVTSKPQAARWAQSALPAQWHPLIHHALRWPHPPQPDALDETLALIRYVLEHI